MRIIKLIARRRTQPAESPAASLRQYYLLVDDEVPLGLVEDDELPMPLPEVPPMPELGLVLELEDEPEGELGVVVVVEDEVEPPGTTTVSFSRVVELVELDPLGVVVVLPPGMTVVVSFFSQADKANAPTITNRYPLRLMFTLLSSEKSLQKCKDVLAISMPFSKYFRTGGTV